MSFDHRRYVAPSRVELRDRNWPNRALEKAPIWCSVDLRDGNQALPDPMGHERKQRLLALLVQVGFREIEIGFPAASQTDFDFARWVVESRALPDGVVPQVITQARDALIDRTLSSIEGAPRAIVHLYNSTSELQRRVVFGMSRREVLELAVRATERIREASERLRDTDITLQYSPESFTGTELDFAVEVSDAVANAWGATPERKMILNLPSTVEMTTPNVFADRIEWIGRNLARRDAIVLSVHTHNDRGTGVASAELAQLAGAERVEGTLLGNGERSGNVDIVTLALNLYSHGVDPGLRFENLPELVRIIEQATRLPVHPRHPYAGELVFVAFSGSHQDAIHKGLKHMNAESERWEVPYLPIDPADVGRAYEPVIRINSQSGKSGLAHVLERDYGYRLPRALAVEFSRTVQLLTDGRGVELSPEEVAGVFEAEYTGKTQPFSLLSAAVERRGECAVRAQIATPSGVSAIAAVGEGPVAAFARGLATMSAPFEIVEYSEHARGAGASAEAVAYVTIRSGTGEGALFHGVGRDRDVVLAAFRALLSSLNRREALARSSDARGDRGLCYRVVRF